MDVDLSEQYARFYDDEGNLVWESDIVSGARGKTDSPTGVYSLNHKQSPTVLIGEMTSEGTPEYESKVSYWMPFKGIPWDFMMLRGSRRSVDSAMPKVSAPTAASIYPCLPQKPCMG